MSENFSSLQSKPSTESSWGEIWTNVLTRPSVTTFQGIVNDAQANTRRAYKWIFLSALLGHTIPILSPLIRGIAPQWIYLLGVPVLAIVAVLAVMLMAAIVQLVARGLGGTGTYPQLVYAFAAFNAPITIITGIIFSFPLGRFILGIYWLALNVIAIKAVNQFGWKRAIVSVLPVLLGVIVVVVAALAIIIRSVQTAGSTDH